MTARTTCTECETEIRFPTFNTLLISTVYERMCPACRAEVAKALEAAYADKAEDDSA